MARNSALKAYADNLVPLLDTGVYNVKGAATPPQAGAGSQNGDYVTLFAINRAGSHHRREALRCGTLGAGCVAADALTRAGADVGTSLSGLDRRRRRASRPAALANLDAQAGDLVELSRRGVVAAAAVCTADVTCSTKRRRSSPSIRGRRGVCRGSLEALRH
jgi:hypothetical protein